MSPAKKRTESRPRSFLKRIAARATAVGKELRESPPKKGKTEIIINEESLETRVAILNGGRLEDFFVERASEDSLVGSIFKGRIQNLEDGLQAAFVDIGMKKNAFIHYWDMFPEDAARLEAEEGIQRPGNKRKRFQPGEMVKQMPIGSEIIVQVTKAAIGTKGPRVTANLSIPGRYLVMMPGSNIKGVSKRISDDKERLRLKKILGRLPSPPNLGFIIRTAGEGARKTAFARDMRVLVETWNSIEEGLKSGEIPLRLYREPDLIERIVRDSLTEDIDRIVIDDKTQFERIRDISSRMSRRARKNIKQYDGHTPIFEHFDIERQLDSAFRRKVWLPTGGYLVFDETEALVAIDINTGRHKGAQNQEDAITEVNVEAAQEIARQLKLRNVGGLVVIDFIDMKQRKNRQTVFRVLKDALRDDKARTNVLPISDLGLLEMTRQRQNQSISSASHIDCPYCRGRGNVKSELSVSVDLQRHLGEVMRKQGSNAQAHNLKVVVHPSVLDRLRREDEAILIDLEQKYQSRLGFSADPGLHISEFGILVHETNEVLYSNVEKGRERWPVNLVGGESPKPGAPS